MELTTDEIAKKLLKDLEAAFVCVLDNRDADNIQILCKTNFEAHIKTVRERAELRSSLYGYDYYVDTAQEKRWFVPQCEEWKRRCTKFLEKRAQPYNFNIIIIPKLTGPAYNYITYTNIHKLYYHVYGDELVSLFIQARIMFQSENIRSNDIYDTL